jgi:hypothetical protein
MAQPLSRRLERSTSDRPAGQAEERTRAIYVPWVASATRRAFEPTQLWTCLQPYRWSHFQSQVER